MSEPIKCPKCGAHQDPDSGELSLTCGSTFVELQFGPDYTTLEMQSQFCKIQELRHELRNIPEERQEVLKEELKDDLESVLRRAIIDSGWSHRKICYRAKVDVKTINRFMAGETDLWFRTAAKIAEVLDLELKAG